MRSKVVIWGVLIAVAVIALAFLSPPIPRTKARAPRISSVNHVSSVSFTLTNASPLPAGQSGTNK